MNSSHSRRRFITLTSAGLIHVSFLPLGDAYAKEDAKLLVRRAKDRGHTDIGWLDSYHSFSFGRYFDPEHMNFRSLQVINDDKVAPGRGFPTHPHRDMEILSYVLDGQLQHRDSTGGGSIIAPDEIQYMSAGSGITHSEFNPSKKDGVHFLQIWITPARKGQKPRYEQEKIATGTVDGRLGLLASGRPKGPHVQIRQDADLYATRLDGSEKASHIVEPGRHAWLQVAKGSLDVNGTTLQAGDAIATSRPTELVLENAENAECLLFNLA